jgi:serine/threonine protein kinase/Flp pilus assembly protein TadD
MDTHQARTVSLAPSSVAQEPETALSHPRSTGDDALPAQVGPYRLEGEIARGGMGRIVRIRDADFDRPLAMKVLLGSGGELEERFLREARLTGILQHPGIPPVHALGRLEDGRPFFVMKLIQGRSLQSLLKERPSPAAELPRFVAIFEQICQTLSYTHVQGVIHRDLKPGNVMVGAFAEVQVLDWGLAKVLHEARPGRSPDSADLDSVLKLAWSAATDQTLPGRALGTPSYMAPEQARGEVDTVDARTDVFGLGAILCDILTGSPPFTGSNVAEVMRQASAGELEAAEQRLARCAADPELVTLARRCLAPRKEGRPADGSSVASAVADYQAELARRLRQAELDRAASDARAEEEKKLRAALEAKARAERTRRRSIMLALIACLALVVAGSAAALWYRDHQAQSARKQANIEQAAQEALVRARSIHDQLSQDLQKPRGVQALLNRPARWQAQIRAALDMLSEARSLLASGEPVAALELRQRTAQLEQILQQDEHYRKLAIALEKTRVDIALIRKGKVDTERTAREYPRVFADAGLPVLTGDVDRLAEQIGSSPIREQLVAALDAWAIAAARKNPGDLKRVLELARRAAPDDWSDRFRQPDVWINKQGLAALIKDAPLDKLSPQLFEAVFFLMDRDLDAEEQWLRQAQARHPNDFWLNVLLGRFLRENKEAAAEAEGFFWTALAIRPDTALVHVHLSIALREQRRLDEAAAACEEAIRLDSVYAAPHFWLARTRYEQQQYDAAVAAARRAIALEPAWESPYNILGLALERQGRLEDAIAAYRNALARDPKFDLAHYNLGHSLLHQGAFEEAAATTQQCLRLRPPAHPGHASAMTQLKECRRLIDLKKRLPAVLDGIAADAAEVIALAEMCSKFLSDHATAANLYNRAFKERPQLADDLGNQHRFAAACAAILALSGKGKQPASRGAANHAELRRRALAWLQADLDSYMNQWKEGKPQAVTLIESRLSSWQTDPALSGVRDAKELARLPEEERPNWEKLWSRVNQWCRDATQAKRSLPEEPFQGTLTAKEPTCVHEMYLTADKIYVINLESTAFDTLLQIKDARGKLLAENDDISPSNLNSRILFPPPRDGFYRFVATSFEKRGVGPFTLRVRAHAGPFTETLLQGSLTVKEQTGVHELDMAADKLYVIHLASTVFDTVLQIKDEAGKLLAENDDISPNDLNSRIAFFPPRAGAYRVLATAHRRRGTGAYTLSVRAYPWSR